jgi:hypothetical protein
VIDVIEIDAASNNGVDDVRQIKDAVMYVPAVARYKVYIIDEVHMLSTGAFIALLKTWRSPQKAWCSFSPQLNPISCLPPSFPAVSALTLSAYPYRG